MMAGYKLLPEGTEWEYASPEKGGYELLPEDTQWEYADQSTPARTGEQVLTDLMPGMGFAEPGPGAPAAPAGAAPSPQGFLPALGQDIGAAFGDVAGYLSAESSGMFSQGWEPSARQLGVDVDSLTPEQRQAYADDWQRRAAQAGQEYGQMRGYLPEPSTRKPANIFEEAVRAVVPMMGTGMLTPAGIYAQVTGNELKQIKQANPDIDDRKALDIARKSGAVQAAIETGFGVSQLGTIYKGSKPFLKKLLGKGSEEVADKTSSFAKKLMARAPAKIAKVGLEEGSEEGLQSVVQAWREAAAAAVARDPDADIMSDDVLRASADIMGTDKWQSDTLRQMGIGALAGGMLGGAPIALGGASSYLQQRGAGGQAGAQADPGQQSEATPAQPAVQPYAPPPDTTAEAVERINSSVDAAMAEVLGEGPAAPPVAPIQPAAQEAPQDTAAAAEGQMTDADMDRARLEQISAALQAQNAPQQAPESQAVPGAAVADQAVNAAEGQASVLPPVQPAAQDTTEARLAQALLESITGQQADVTDDLAAAMSEAEQPAVSESESGEPGARTPTGTGPESVAGAQPQEQAAGVGGKAKAEEPMAKASSDEVPGPSESGGAARTWQQRVKDRRSITVEHPGMKPVTLKKGDKVTQIVDGEPSSTTVRTIDAAQGLINGKPAKMFYPSGQGQEAPTARPIEKEPVKKKAFASPTHYRRTSSGSPVSDWGHAMFSEDEEEITSYGDNLYAVDTGSNEDVTVSADSDEFAGAMRDAILKNWDKYDIDQYDSGEYTREELADKLVEEANPDDIVNSAGVWDSDLVELISNEVLEPNGWEIVETYNGAVVFNENLIEQGTIDEDGVFSSSEDVSRGTEVGAEAAGSEAVRPSGSPRVSPAQAAKPEVVTKIRDTGSKSQAETYGQEKVVSQALDDAVRSGAIGTQEADVIKGMLSEFPESWQERLEVRVSGQEFEPTKEQKQATGTGGLKGARITSTAELKRIDDASRDAKTVITMFKGSDVVDFTHEIGEFVYKRLLTNTEKQLITKLKAKDRGAKKSMYKNEWFSDQFEKWWLHRKPMSKGLTDIFTRILKSIKNIYKRIRGDVSPELQVILEDIVVNGRDIKDQNIFFTNNDVVRMYIVGADPTANKVAEQGFSGNAKTLMSWDPSSICPKQQNFIDWIAKQVESNGLNWGDLASIDVISGLWDSALADGVDVPCSYCYVEEGRRKAIAAQEAGKTQSGVRFTQAKQVYKQVPYVDRIIKMPQTKIDELNKSGGLRMFSFSDYVRVSHRTEVDKLLRDAAKRGLSIKAITKNPEFVEDFGDTGITINLSIDKTRHGMPWDTAAKLKRKYPNVKVRATALNMKEFNEYAELAYGGFEQFVDVITPYHHENTSEPVPEGFEDMTWDKVGGKKMNAYAKTVPGLLERVCCQEGGKCFNNKTQTQCATNCGIKAGNLTIPRVDDIRFRQPDSIKKRMAKNPGRQPEYTEKKKWPKAFPNVTTHTTIKKLREHPKYESAKSGDVGSAVAVVSDLSNDTKIKAMGKRYPSAIIVAPHAVEATGNNAIPETLASYISDVTGLQIDRNIVQANSPQRTAKNSEERLVHRPVFDGPVVKGAEYILVDDAVGSGGTFSEMRSFIEVNGGRVVDTMALTGGLFSNKLSIRPSTVSELNKKFGRKNLADFLKKIELAKSPEYLTEKEGRFILRQKSLESLRDRIPAPRQKARSEEGPGTAKTTTSVTAATTTPASTTLYSGIAAIPTRVLGGAVSGAMAGGAIGGPVGMAVGASLGTISELGGITKAWDSAVSKRIRGSIEKAPVIGRGVKAARRAMDTKYRGDLKDTPAYLREHRRTRLAMMQANDYAIDLGNRLSSMPEDAQMRMGEAIRGEINPADLAPKERELAEESIDILKTLGKRAVEAGLLKEETYFKNVGRYMPRLYTSKEYQGLLSKYGLSKPNRLDLSRFKKRKDIPKEIREQMGEILTPGYPVAKGIVQMAHDIELAHMFKRISENPDWAFQEQPDKDVVDAVKASIAKMRDSGMSFADAVDAISEATPGLDITTRTTKAGRQVVDVRNVGSAPANFVKLPKNKKLGALSEAYIHPEIFNDINDSIIPQKTWEKTWNKALGAWKFGKVILSPKTHMRNLISNSLLMHMGGLPLYKQPMYMVESARELKNKGDIYKEAKDQGLMSSTFTSSELRELYDQVNSQMDGIKAGSVGDVITAWGKVNLAMRSFGRQAAKMYELEEQWGKLAMFAYARRSLGLDPEGAAEYANKWLFDYGDLTRFQKAYRRNPMGAPFATFTFKAIPRVAETLVKYPHRLMIPLAIINGLGWAAAQHFKDDDKRKKAKEALRPEWMQGSFMGTPNFQRIPVTDNAGREYWLNLSYILPWGDIAESGGAFGIPGGLMPMSQPLTKEAWQQISNYDLFWDQKIVKEKDTAGLTTSGKIWAEVRKRGGHLIQTMAPTPVIDASKIYDAYKNIPDYRGRYRPRSVVVADLVAGFKAYPVDYDDQGLRQINKYHPKIGRIARDLLRDIRTDAVKQAAMEKDSAGYKQLNEDINRKINQLTGVSNEMVRWADIYSAAKRKDKPAKKTSWLDSLGGI